MVATAKGNEGMAKKMDTTIFLRGYMRGCYIDLSFHFLAIHSPYNDPPLPPNKLHKYGYHCILGGSIHHWGVGMLLLRAGD